MTNPQQLRIGLVGTGSIAREHARVLQALPHVQLAAVVSRTRPRAEAFAAEFGGAVVYDHLRTMVREEQPDALLITCSVDQLTEVALAAIEYGCPLLIEKPPGINWQETQRLADAAEQSGTRTMVGFNRRYYSVFKEGLDAIHRHGALRGVQIEGHERFWRILETGVTPELRQSWIYANATHTIDLLRYFGGEIAVSQAYGTTVRESSGDQFVAAMRFESGAIGTYTAHWFSPGGWRVLLYGDGITVSFAPLEEGKWQDTTFATHMLPVAEADQSFKPGFFGQMQAFLEMVRTYELAWPGQDLRQSLRTMLVARALLDSVTSAAPPPK